MRTIRAAVSALSPREKIVFWTAIVFAAITVITISFLYLLKNTRVVPGKGGTFREGLIGQPTVINPILAASEADQTLTKLTFATLRELADKLEPETPDNGSRKWRVRLKEGLVWQDGKKITADDVLFTITKIQDPSETSPLRQSWRGINAERLSELEIRFTLGSPYAFFSEQLGALAPIPKHIFEDVPLANWRLSDFALKPVGSGPFTVRTMDRRPDGFFTRYTLEANWHFALAAPRIDKLEIIFFSKPEDLVQGFNRGEVDGLVLASQAWIDQVIRPHQKTALNLPSYYAVFFNQSQSDTLRDRSVRLALSKAVDRQGLIAGSGTEKGRPAHGPVPPGFPAALEVEPNSPRAQEIGKDLEQAGWIIQNSERFRSGPGGAPLSFRLTAPNTPPLANIAEKLAEQWSQIGAEVKLDLRDPQTLQAETIRNRDYEALLIGNTLIPSGDLMPFWHSAERFHPGQNLSLFNNRTVDGLIEKARKSSDSAERESALTEVQRMILSEAPAVFLFAPEYAYIHTPKVRGIRTQTSNYLSDRFQNVWEWYTQTTRVFGE